MRFAFALLALFLVLGMVSGCSSSSHSFFNGSHLAKHFTCIYYDMDRLHYDIDTVLLGIEEQDEDLKVALD